MIWSPRFLEFKMDTRIVAFSIIGLILTAVIKQWKVDFLPFLRIAILAALLLYALSSAIPFIAFVKDLMNNALGEWATGLLKALAIAILTQICADMCRECGESSMANGVELIGKMEILILALPLMEAILELANDLLALGGG